MGPWLLGARPRTLPAAVAPVLVGTACAAPPGLAGLADVHWGRAALALVVALALQVGVNYANDYSDGVRGADANRVGPARLVASGLKPAAAVRRAAFLAFVVAAAAGVALALLVGDLRLVAVGAACLLAAWFYTGGPRPYGYRGLGEASVFVFFGLVATVGSAYAQTGPLGAFPPLAAAAAVPVGALAAALLVVNNLRDLPGDAAAGKRTLAVRLGDQRTRWLYVTLLAAGVTAPANMARARPGALAALAVLPLAVGAGRRVLGGARGAALVPVLGETGRLQLAFGILLAAGVWLSA